MSKSNGKIATLPSHADVDGLPKNPFGQLGLPLSDFDLRETAYDILVAVCRSSGASRPLTYVSSSNGRNTERSLSNSPSMASSAASKVKRALGLKSKKKISGSDPVEGQTRSSAGQGHQRKRSLGVGELMRIQMRVSEQSDSRVRRALLRVAAGQLGRKVESMVLPLELLQQFRSSDFSNQAEYEAWQKRNLEILKAGLLVHPHLPLDNAGVAAPARQLKQIILEASGKPMDTGKHSESMKILRNVVTALACRSFDGSVSEMCHWADGIPLNLSIYKILLESCFDVNDETSVIEEVDEVLELVKKTWTVLGVNQDLHNLCFAWVLFYQYVATGQTEPDLLLAAQKLLLELEKEMKTTDDSASWSMIASTLSLIMDWAESKLLSYHEFFYRGNIDAMQHVLTLGLSAAKMLQQDFSHEYYRKSINDVACNRVDSYVRSSLQRTYLQEKENLKSSRQSNKSQQTSVPMLSTLAQNITDLAFNEKEIYSPVLKQWHPLATGVAAATLHACYGNDLKHFISSISELNPSAVQVLIASERLEKDLVQMAVADTVDSDDGGKGLIQEMTPYESEAAIAKLVKSWIKTRVDRLKEWVQRNLQQEVWNPHANKERFAPSAVEVLRLMDETLEAFFLLPIPMHQVLVPELMGGLDKCLQNYVLKAKSGCGTKTDFVPALPALTRCTVNSKFGVFKKKDRSHMVSPKKPHVGTAEMESSFGTPQLCCRMNTMHLIRKELEVLRKRITFNLAKIGYNESSDVTNWSGIMFELSSAACVEGIQQLSEVTAYKIIFRDLSHVLWEHLYVGDISASRIDPFLQELEHNLEIVSATVHDRVRTRAITDIMRVSFEGFLLVLLAGGPSRAFTLQDASTIEEDFKALMDLFWSGGDGLPIDLITKFSTNTKEVIRLFHRDSENLIGQFKRVTAAKYGTDKSQLPLPPTSGQWSPTDPNTLLRILCHRNDEVASRFLKKTYSLPKKV